MIILYNKIGYTYNIPDVLVDLRHYLMEKKGLEEEGVFRVAGDEAETGKLIIIFYTFFFEIY